MRGKIWKVLKTVKQTAEDAVRMKAVWQISCCDIREAALVLFQGTGCHIQHVFAIV